jgi:hypothetical protein
MAIEGEYELQARLPRDRNDPAFSKTEEAAELREEMGMKMVDVEQQVRDYDKAFSEYW